MRRYAATRWRRFAKNTTFHGVKEFEKGQSLAPKTLWALIIATSTGALIYQTYGLVDSHLKESTVTQISALDRPYPNPRVMVSIPTKDLVQPVRQRNDSMLPEMDPDAFLYARSIVEPETYVPDTVRDFDPRRAKEKFEGYLKAHNVTWAEALEPYILDIEPWMMSTQGPRDPPIHVSRRLVWYPFTYHLIEPIPENTTSPKSDLPYSWASAMPGHYVIFFNWSASPLPKHVRHVTIASFELLNDNFRLYEGGKYKLTFDIAADHKLNLRRQPCDQLDEYRYRKYDDYACREKCSLDAIMDRYPDRCLWPPDHRFSFLGIYPRGIPCSDGMYVTKSGKNITRPSLDRLPLQPDVPLEIQRNITQTSQICEQQRCFKPCKELMVKYQLNQGTLADDQPPDKSMFIFEWPIPEAVTVFEENYMYTTETLVGQWGGLIGLWLGASLMSFFEIIYYCCFCCLHETDTVEAVQKM